MLFPLAMIFAQEQNSSLNLTLKQAQDYAVSNNKAVKSAKLDVMASRAAVWETISAALPSVEGSGSFTDNLKLMTTLLPGEFFGQPGEKIPVTFGSKYNTGVSVQASMLLFNAPLYIGIETTKLANKLSEQNLERTELDIKESVSTVYFLILVAEESLRILDSNIVNLNETLRSVKSMYQVGMAESTDVDQMMSNVTMAENSRSTLLRNIELDYNLLRFQLGVPGNTEISLTETLENLIDQINVDAILSQNFDINNNVDYKLITMQEEISALTVMSQKASVLPTLAGFYTYGTNGMGDKVSDQRWFPNSMVGLQLSIPVFASGQRYTKIKKAQLDLSKARNNKALVTDQLLMQEKQLKYDLVNANLQYLSQKDNVEVSKRVYTSMENKYRQGMASSLELTQANSQYLQAENNYITSLMSLLQTKVALDKLMNNM
ncbi:MAG TPA: TolC family protein [Bacteroidales bacterium]|nr:TolC family protein [Bacteroidales bacterium]HQB37019.1 TolC family protein [Bacteroidales bacterium]